MIELNNKVNECSEYKVSFIIPCMNEAASLDNLLCELVSTYPGYEIVVVDDGSSDTTALVAKQHRSNLISHPYNLGNGAAVKSGARAANGDVLIFMDADGQHPIDKIDDLVKLIEQGYDMAIAARHNSSHASKARLFANTAYNWISSKIVGHDIKDLTSGFRAVKADKFREFLYLLPNGFSYPTTITMAFFRTGYSIAYSIYNAQQREGKSHIRPIKDGVRFLLIIFRITTLYSPLKLFFPASFIFFLVGSGYGLFTLLVMHRFTNMSTLLLLAGSLIFLFGLLAEQITFLLYKK